MQAEIFHRFLSQLRACGVLLLLTSQCLLELGSVSVAPLQLRLDPLGPEDATALLRLEAGDAAPAEEHSVRLIRVCGPNALAITLLGGLLRWHRTCAAVSLPRHAPLSACSVHAMMFPGWRLRL